MTGKDKQCFPLSLSLSLSLSLISDCQIQCLLDIFWNLYSGENIQTSLLSRVQCVHLVFQGLVHNSLIPELTLSQNTNFRLYQTQRVYRRQF